MRAARLIPIVFLTAQQLCLCETPRWLEDLPANVKERGPHHKVWERAQKYVTSYGKVYYRTNSYVELATGLHYWEDGQWKDSSEEITIADGAAVARKGQHQVIFAANLNSPGAIELLGPDGKRFRSHVLGLAYTDLSTGQSIMIAQVKDCNGAVLPPNQVYYLDAFEGDCRADVRYTYTKAGFEQDIILLTAPPSPAEWGLAPETTRLEVFTEFLEAPTPAVVDVVLKRETDPLLRQLLTEPDLIDQQLDFGGMGIGPGQAFPLGHEDLFDGSSVSSGKSWEQVEGRVFLIEKVDYQDVVSQLNALPQTASRRNKADPLPPNVGTPEKLLVRSFPPRPSGERGRWQENQFARADLESRAGLVIDYVTLNGSVTNYTFQGDTTYYISSTVQLYGTNVIEGGTVIKFATNGRLEFYGQIDCRTDPWHPGVLTAKDDHTVGETLSTNSISGYYAYYALFLKNTTLPYDLHDIRVRYSTYGLAMQGAHATFSHLQVGNCQKGVAWMGGTLRCRNLLFHDMTYGLYSTGSVTNAFEQGTFHRMSTFRQLTNSNVYLTNCLLISVTNNVIYSGTNVVTTLDDTGVFVSVAAGSRYLPDNSPYRDAGTTSINADLLDALKTRTTYAPVLLSNDITSDTMLGRYVARDDDTPDLGYHYDPIEYICRSISISNASVLVTNAATIGIDFDGTDYGINLASGARFVSQGFGDHLNRFVRIHAVQEGPAASASYYTFFRSDEASSNKPTLKARFTEFPLLSGSFLWAEEDGLSYLGELVHQDCQMYGGHFWWGVGTSNTVGSFTNNLFARVQFLINPVVASTNLLVNNLFWRGAVTLDATFATFLLYDNVFECTNLIAAGSFTNNYNAYIINAARLSPAGSNDVILTNTPSFGVGPLGYHYYPTNDGMLSTLIDAGSRNATNAGLYHFTTTTDQVKEAASQVDIGFHYIAVDSEDHALDDGGDGIPDYLEDLNGNGIYDSGSGETDWETYDSLFGIGSEPALDVFTPLK